MSRHIDGTEKNVKEVKIKLNIKENFSKIRERLLNKNEKSEGKEQKSLDQSVVRGRPSEKKGLMEKFALIREKCGKGKEKKEITQSPEIKEQKSDREKFLERIRVDRKDMLKPEYMKKRKDTDTEERIRERTRYER